MPAQTGQCTSLRPHRSRLLILYIMRRKCFIYSIVLAVSILFYFHIVKLNWKAVFIISSTDSQYTLDGQITRNLQVNKSLNGMWICMPLGRLGNLMGEYAVLYALSKLNGYKAFLVPRMHKNLSPVFNLSLPVLDQQTVNNTPWRNYILHDWMSDKYKHIKGDYIRLVGYTSSWTFYHHIREEILREFTFHDYISKEASYFLWKISKGRTSVTFVGVHVRRGDYVSIMANIWKGVVGDQTYFQKAMDFFRKKYKDAVFVVATNGLDWCKKNIDTSKGDVYFIGDGTNATAARDLAILAKCNHTIMSVGTFGYWAAYLAGGETVYLSNFTGPDSRLLRRFKYETAFLPQWIGIPADLSPLLKN